MGRDGPVAVVGTVVVACAVEPHVATEWTFVDWDEAYGVGRVVGLHVMGSSAQTGLRSGVGVVARSFEG